MMKTVSVKKLTSAHHDTMINAFGILKHVFKSEGVDRQESTDVLLIGLGGGLLASYIVKTFSNVSNLLLDA